MKAILRISITTKLRQKIRNVTAVVLLVCDQALPCVHTSLDSSDVVFTITSLTFVA